MLGTKEYSLDQLRDYATLFTRSCFFEWMNGDFSSINYKVKRYDSEWLITNNVSYLDYLKYAYNAISIYYQNEYVLKNSFLDKWLIKEVGEDGSKLFNEFRIGDSVADLVMFNGSSKVFEIKTEYDSDKRLQTQIASYRKVFNYVFLIVPKTKVHLYDKYGDDIGIITFHGARKQKFSLYRDAMIQERIDVSALIHLLHTKEYKSIVRKHFGQLPKMTSFNQFDICHELMNKIPQKNLNHYFIDQMKMRGLENALSKRYFKEFNQLSLALKLSKQKRKKMFEMLKRPIEV